MQPGYGRPPVSALTPSLPEEALRDLQAHPFWYHTIDLAPGVTTPGWFDLRRSLDAIPLPDVRGKRCLDIGTYDGFFAFELERRGAAHVVATDIEDHTLWDWPADARPGLEGVEEGRHISMHGPPKGTGFRLIAELIGSNVEWRTCNIYDLSPDDLGMYDVVVCGSLLLHLRDPIRALEAVRSVTRGVLVSSDQIELWTSVLARGRPLFKLNGSGQFCQWWLANAAGHARMLYAAGFDITERSKPYIVRYNQHPKPRLGARELVRRAATWGLTGDRSAGVFHRAVVARPRL